MGIYAKSKTRVFARSAHQPTKGVNASKASILTSRKIDSMASGAVAGTEAAFVESAWLVVAAPSTSGASIAYDGQPNISVSLKNTPGVHYKLLAGGRHRR